MSIKIREQKKNVFPQTFGQNPPRVAPSKSHQIYVAALNDRARRKQNLEFGIPFSSTSKVKHMQISRSIRMCLCVGLLRDLFRDGSWPCFCFCFRGFREGKSGKATVSACLTLTNTSVRCVTILLRLFFVLFLRSVTLTVLTGAVILKGRHLLFVCWTRVFNLDCERDEHSGTSQKITSDDTSKYRFV